jgi:hypothetical protein
MHRKSGLFFNYQFDVYDICEQWAALPRTVTGQLLHPNNSPTAWVLFVFVHVSESSNSVPERQPNVPDWRHKPIALAVCSSHGT